MRHLATSTSHRLARRLGGVRRLHSTQAASAAADAPTFEATLPSLATATFDWRDPLALSASLTEEERQIYEMARSFSQKELLPGVVAASRAETFDKGIMRGFGQMGLLGLTCPAEYGGAEAGYVAYGLCARAVEQVDSGYRSAMSVQSSLVMHPISIFGSEEQKQQWPPRATPGPLPHRAPSLGALPSLCTMRGTGGSRRSPRERRLAASASPSPTPAPTPRAWARAPRGTHGHTWCTPTPCAFPSVHC